MQNPQSLLDEFALVPPGQLTNPTQVSVLFDAPGVDPARIGQNVSTPATSANSNGINPQTIVLTVATVGMLLIALVSIGGFTVLAQRRLRALGMLESMGATDRNVRLVIRANGGIVGIVGALVGFALGLAVWLAYRPHDEQAAHHLIPMFALPWAVVIPSMVLAVVATLFAADRPARAITRVPVVSALAGRPPPPRQIHRSFIPGVVALVIGFVFFSLSGAGQQGSGVIWLIPGFVALIAGIILVSPFFLAALARMGRRSPIAIRLPLRDMSRYRARSGSALAAISVGVLIAVVIARRSRPLLQCFRLRRPERGVERAHRVHPPTGPTLVLAAKRSRHSRRRACRHRRTPSYHRLVHRRRARRRTRQSVSRSAEPQCERASVERTHLRGDAGALAGLWHQPGVHPVQRRRPHLPARSGGLGRGADLRRRRKGRTTDRPGLRWPRRGSSRAGQHEFLPAARLCRVPRSPRRGRLPSGTSAPNTVITESALRRLHLANQNSLQGWMILTRSPITSAQITNARTTAATNDLTIESKNDAPTSSEIVNWATVFGIALALGILAMSVGLIRSETASDLRTLAATGASSRTRRSLTAVTAGGLAFLGALLGTLAAYIGLFGWFRSNSLEGGVSDIINHVPWSNLFLIVIAMPIAATIIGWVLAGREPEGSRRGRWSKKPQKSGTGNCSGTYRFPPTGIPLCSHDASAHVEHRFDTNAAPPDRQRRPP